nr:response regulator [Desulfurispira natronophila]
MKQKTLSFKLLFLLPVLVVAVAVSIITLWSVEVLKRQYEENHRQETEDLLILGESAGLGQNLASIHQRAASALAGAQDGSLDQGDIYRIHTQGVDDLARATTKVEDLVRSLRAKGIHPQEEGQPLLESYQNYRNYLLMATDIVAIDPGQASSYIYSAQQHYIHFMKTLNRVSHSLTQHAQEQSNRSLQTFRQAYSQVLLIGLAGLVAMLVIAFFATHILSHRILLVTRGMGMLARSQEVPPQLPEVQRLQEYPVREVREIAGAVLSFRQALVERRALEEEVRRHRDHLAELVEEQTLSIKAIVDTAADAIITIDQEGKILTFNGAAQRMFGYDAGEAVGADVSLLMPEPHRSQHSYYIRRYLESGEAQALGRGAEVTGQRRDGTTFPIYLTISEMIINHEQRFTGIARDITDQKAAEAALVASREAAEAANRAKGEFLANMSHEIRTPMNAIIGLTRLCLQTPLSPKQDDYLSKISASANALLGILNDILDFSKIDAGKLEIDPVEFSLEEVVANLVAIISVRSEEKGLEFLIDTALDIPPRLTGDPLRLGQVLINLVSNAVKFTESGEVVVHSEVIDEDASQVWLRFGVTDTGIGMTPAQQEKLFQAFSQADTSTTRQYGGSGLGLVISKQLIMLMGGEISMESEPGKGTVFEFTLPFGKVEKSRQPEDLHIPRNLRDLQVLAVDDNSTSLEILGHYLDSFGYQSDTASSGDQALQLVKSADARGCPYDLVMLDWKMPRPDGMETARHIQQTALVSPPRLLLFSSFGSNEMQRHLQQGLVDGILAKPFLPNALFDAISRIFEDRSSPDSQQLPGATSSQRSAPLAGKSILLVEDNEINQQITRELLQQMGAKTTIAWNGQEAVDLLAQAEFDGVLMDMQMPVMDGIAATRKIREEAKFSRLPIIAMTANAMASDHQRCLEAGMNDFMVKPVDPEKLTRVLNRWLSTGAGDTWHHESREPALALPDLPGFKVREAVGRLAGSVETYRSLLAKFPQHYQDSARDIAAALDDGDAPRAQKLTHTLKGVAGNLGAVELQEKLEELEEALRQGTATSQCPKFLEVAEKLEFVLKIIRQEIGDGKGS